MREISRFIRFAYNGSPAAVFAKFPTSLIPHKGSDGFGPIGPAIVTGLDYESLELETRVNRVAG
jgi:hypothetical protein